MRLRHAATALGALIVLGALLVALFGPSLVRYDPFAQDLMRRLVPPAWLGGDGEHALGTDQLGRDYLARLVYGARISLLIGTVAALTSGLIGITLGVLGGFFGGRVDDFVMFAITCRLSIPAYFSGARSRFGGGQLAYRRRADARTSAVGPVRRRGAHDHDAGPHARLRGGDTGRPAHPASTCCGGRSCPISRTT